MFVRQLTYLVALAKERHFARAAEACHVTQPALSAAVRSIEQELGITIVQRGKRFEGFTPEGERVLVWARRILDDYESLRQDAAESSAQISGVLRLGAIPTVLFVVPLLTGTCLAQFPDVSHEILSLSAEDIIRRLDAFELDIGITYLTDERLKGFQKMPLFVERYVLIARDAEIIGSPASLSWTDIADLPLCVLTPNMQNRRIIDAAFRDAGVTPRIAVETDSIAALYAQVRSAGLFSIVPHTMLHLAEMRQAVKVIPLTPELRRPIGLIATGKNPVPPLIAAAWSAFGELDLQSQFDQATAGIPA